MCGIAGAVMLDPDRQADAGAVRRMTNALAHRGPDAEGFWHSPSGLATFGHRRLSIIDLASGQQPMVSADGKRAITFNGEIYNYIELRDELIAAGEHFATQSDTEVLLRLYELQGERCVEKLQGMFAFAVWDEDKRKLFLARDRIGKKPLYYTTSNDCFYFSSSLDSLRQGVNRRWNINLQSVDAFLTFSYIPAPATIFEGVRKLAAGQTLRLEKGDLQTRTFWNPRTHTEPFDGTYEQAVDRLDELLNTAVRFRLRSDVPLGVFLSGGVDSTLVTALAARHANETLRTFTVGFDEAQFDEATYAAEVARTLGTEHIALRGRPDLVNLLPGLVRHFGEPFADASAMPIWILAEETRKYVTVALGGDGGDEGFAGYPWYPTAVKLNRLGGVVPSQLAAVGGKVLERFGQKSPSLGRASRVLSLLSETDANQFARLRMIVDPPEVRRLYAGQLAQLRATSPAAPGEYLERIYSGTDGSALQRMRCVDIETYLADLLMPKVDVATMAHGLEVRAPLLDHLLIEFALSLPDNWLIGQEGGKGILKTLAQRYLPASFFTRPKRGFDVPLELWFGGEMRGTVDRLTQSSRLLDTGWFEPSGLRQLAHDHWLGVRDQTNRLYNLLVLEEWLGQQ